MIQDALFYYLTNDATDLIAEVQTKVYPFSSVPTGTDRPYITYQIIDNSHTHHQGGASGLADPRFQFDVWANIEYDAYRILDILRKALDVFRGPMGEAGSEKTVRLIVADTDNESYVAPTDGKQKGVYRASGDFLVWFVEEV